ncbi:MAG: GNAT family N-acetyltransferase, partial [Gemmobacter sp.]
MIRQATAADAAAIGAIWNPLIRETTITFDTREKTAADIAALIADRPAFLVADAGGIAGLATYGPFRGGTGYALTGEHTVILAAPGRGRGIGRALMAGIEDHARARGLHAMVAAVSAENAAGIGFHAALGYSEVGRMPEVGF